MGALGDTEKISPASSKNQPSSYMLSHHTWSPSVPLINVAAQCMPASEPKWLFFEGLSKQSDVTTLNWGKGGMQVSSQGVWQDGCFFWRTRYGQNIYIYIYILIIIPYWIWVCYQVYHVRNHLKRKCVAQKRQSRRRCHIKGILLLVLHAGNTHAHIQLRCWHISIATGLGDGCVSCKQLHHAKGLGHLWHIFKKNIITTIHSSSLGAPSLCKRSTSRSKASSVGTAFVGMMRQTGDAWSWKCSFCSSYDWSSKLASETYVRQKVDHLGLCKTRVNKHGSCTNKRASARRRKLLLQLLLRLRAAAQRFAHGQQAGTCREQKKPWNAAQTSHRFEVNQANRSKQQRDRATFFPRQRHLSHVSIPCGAVPTIQKRLFQSSNTWGSEPYQRRSRRVRVWLRRLRSLRSLPLWSCLRRRRRLSVSSITLCSLRHLRSPYASSGRACDGSGKGSAAADRPSSAKAPHHVENEIQILSKQWETVQMMKQDQATGTGLCGSGGWLRPIQAQFIWHSRRFRCRQHSRLTVTLPRLLFMKPI